MRNALYFGTNIMQRSMVGECPCDFNPSAKSLVTYSLDWVHIGSFAGGEVAEDAADGYADAEREDYSPRRNY